jgi:hypothetical protein
MDNLGNLTTENDMDIKSFYRVVVNVVMDLNYLNIDAIDRIKNYIQEEKIRLNNIVKKVNITEDNLKTGSRDVYVNGVEQYSNELFIDTYLDIFKVIDPTIVNDLKLYNKEEDKVFKLTENFYKKVKLKQIDYNVIRLLKNKEN